MRKLVLLLSCICSVAMLKALELPSLFMDNMVLQQQTDVTFWGTASRDHNIYISTGWGEHVVLHTDQQGRWQGTVQTPAAGGPYEVVIRSGDDEKVIHNVLIGEVWLCAGQSNMAMPLTGWPPKDTIRHAQKTIEQANYPGIRFFSVNRAISASPAERCEGEWQVCTPETAASFSATAYFFGRQIHRELGVPVGLIHSSWGGTPVESWMSQERLMEYDDFRPVIDNIRNSKPQIELLDRWLKEKPEVRIDEDKAQPWHNLQLRDEKIPGPAYDDTLWPVMELPVLWENTSVGSFDGVIWFRKQIKLPAAWMEQDLVLELGPVDDMDITYWNGHEVGSHQQEGLWDVKRKYRIPADILSEGENVIAVRVIDIMGGGGIYGEVQEMKIYRDGHADTHISLAGEWKYLPVAEYTNRKLYIMDAAHLEYLNRPRIPVDISQNTASFLYNAMIHPLIPYHIKGVIWYQGESNTGKPEQYDDLFPGMIDDWRERWQQDDFPFYYVQIAPYDYGHQTRSQRLREAQLKALKVPHTGMVVTLDIGNPSNIHPANKEAVGDRLAKWALAKNYGKDIVYSGPLYKKMETDGRTAVIHFAYTGSGLTTYDETLKHFVIAGEDGQFHPAKAVIKGDRVEVTSPFVQKPVAVRYAWDNTSEASLFNKEGLPASSFRTDQWE